MYDIIIYAYVSLQLSKLGRAGEGLSGSSTDSSSSVGDLSLDSLYSADIVSYLDLH